VGEDQLRRRGAGGPRPRRRPDAGAPSHRGGGRGPVPGDRQLARRRVPREELRRGRAGAMVHREARHPRRGVALHRLQDRRRGGRPPRLEGARVLPGARAPLPDRVRDRRHGRAPAGSAAGRRVRRTGRDRRARGVLRVGEDALRRAVVGGDASLQAAGGARQPAARRGPQGGRRRDRGPRRRVPRRRHGRRARRRVVRARVRHRPHGARARAPRGRPAGVRAATACGASCARSSSSSSAG